MKNKDGLFRVGDVITVTKYIGDKTFPYYRIDPVTRQTTNELQEFKVTSVSDDAVEVSPGGK